MRVRPFREGLPYYVAGVGTAIMMWSHRIMPSHWERAQNDAAVHESIALYAVGLAVVLASMFVRPSRLARGTGA